jgi:Tol biopolymer transport system component
MVIKTDRLEARLRATVAPTATIVHRLSLILFALTLAFALLSSTAAMAAGPTTSLVSVSSTGAAANDVSYAPAISKDGRFVAFASNATNLVSADTNGHVDVFLRDRMSGLTSRVSLASDGTQANNNSFSPAISADGHFIFFMSYATNLVKGPDEPKGSELRIYRYDRLTGTQSLVPLPAGVTTVSEESSTTSGYSVDSDGGRVAFVGFGLGSEQIYLWDAATNAFKRLSETAAGVVGNSYSIDPAISGDGKSVAFTSNATNLVSPDENNFRDVFVKNVETGAIERISTTSAGGESNLHSSTPAIDYDGCWAGFFTDATNLVAIQNTEKNQMIARDRCSGTGSQVLTLTNANAQFKSRTPLAVSDDGCRFVFIGESFLSAWMRDRCAGATTRLDLSNTGEFGKSTVDSVTISRGTGRYVAFDSTSTNLVPGDENGVGDVFVRDLANNTPPVAVLSAHVEGAQVTADGTVSSDPDGYQLTGSINWGDGSAPDPGLSGVHTYTHPGTYGVQILVTDADGATSTALAAVTVGSSPPGGGGGPSTGGGGSGGGPASEPTQLLLDRVSLAKSRFLVGSKVDSSHGTSLALRLSAPATVTFTFERAVTGRKVKGVCKPGAKKGTHCTKYVRDGVSSRSLPAGSADVAITGMLGKLKLAIGTHRLIVQARGLDGETTVPKTVTFMVTAPKKKRGK